MYKYLLTLSLAFMVIFIWNAIPTAGYQQTSISKAPRANQPPVPAITQGPFGQNNQSPNLYVQRYNNQSSPFAQINQANPMSEAVQALKEAEGDTERRDAEDKVRELLVKQYDAFLVENEQQIDQLQKRLDDLRDQLERRRRAQQKMVDLEMQRVINESEGLVWPSAGDHRRGMFWRPSPPDLAVPTPAASGPTGSIRARRSRSNSAR